MAKDDNPSSPTPSISQGEAHNLNQKKVSELQSLDHVQHQDGNSSDRNIDEILPIQNSSFSSPSSNSNPKKSSNHHHNIHPQQIQPPTTVQKGSSSSSSKFGLGPRPAVFPSLPREILFILIATTATGTASFLQGASSIITSSIGTSLSMTQGEITWITASTALTAGAFQLGLGQLADLTGRKTMFIVGLASFSAFSLLVAFAKTAYWMDIVSGILGICSAMVVPPAIGIMGAAYDLPSKRKNLAFSAFSAGNPLGFVFGSILCGVITRAFEGVLDSRDSWRSAYVMIAVLWAGFTVLAVWSVPSGVEAFDTDDADILAGNEKRRQEQEKRLVRRGEGEGVGGEEVGIQGVSREERQKESFGVRMRRFIKVFDSTGTILTIFGTGMLTAGITLGPADGWGSPQVIALLTVGAILLVIFVFWERVYPTPLMPPHIWKDRNFTFIILSCLPGYMAFISTNFWLAFFMQDQQHLSPLIVAVHLLPQAIAGLIYNIIAGSILHRINNTLLLVIGSICYLGSNVLLSVMPSAESSYWAFVFPSLVLSVVGADFQFNVSNMYVMQSLPSHQQALAGGIFSTIFRLGSAVALGISTAVFTSVRGDGDRNADIATAATSLHVVNTAERSDLDPMLPYTRAFQVSVALAASSFLFLPFVRVGTQGGGGGGGNSGEVVGNDDNVDAGGVGVGVGCGGEGVLQESSSSQGEEERNGNR